MKKTLKMLCSLFLAMVMVVSVAVIPSSAAKVKLNKTSVMLIKDNTTTLKVSGTSKTVKWSSLDSDIASVSSKGKVIAKKPGTTYILAEVGSKTLKCKVQVVVGKLSVDKTSVTVDIGKSAKIKVTAVGSHSISASSSDIGVAKASWKNAKWNGNTVYLTIKGVSPGTARIKVYSKKYPNSLYKYITVNVKGNLTGNSEKVEDDSDESVSLDGMSYAEQVLYYCNLEREKAGVEPLKLDTTLCSAAYVRATETVTFWSHKRPGGKSCFTAMDEAGYKYSTAAENIAYGSSSAKDIVDMWMNSPGHRANILSRDYTHLGVGKSGEYWVQLFACPA